MSEPREVTDRNGSKRWVTSDGRTFDSKAAALAASPEGAEFKNPSAPLKTFHLRGDGNNLLQGLPSQRWVVAESPERALQVCIINMAEPVTKRGGFINVYLYERASEGLVSFEGDDYCVARFSEEDRRRLAHEALYGPSDY